MAELELLSYWHWWVLAVVLLVLEVLTPVAYFLWMGIAAALVGVLMYAFPDLHWAHQFIVFSIISVVAIVLWRKRLSSEPTPTDRPNLNRRGHEYVGRTFTLEQAVVNGVGKLKVDDSTWKIRGPDCAVGSRVQVTGVDGVVLIFELMDAPS